MAAGAREGGAECELKGEQANSSSPTSRPLHIARPSPRTGLCNSILFFSAGLAATKEGTNARAEGATAAGLLLCCSRFKPMLCSAKDRGDWKGAMVRWWCLCLEASLPATLPSSLKSVLTATVKAVGCAHKSFLCH